MVGAVVEGCVNRARMATRALMNRWLVGGAVVSFIMLHLI